MPHLRHYAIEHPDYLGVSLVWSDGHPLTIYETCPIPVGGDLTQTGARLLWRIRSAGEYRIVAANGDNTASIVYDFAVRRGIFNMTMANPRAQILNGWDIVRWNDIRGLNSLPFGWERDDEPTGYIETGPQIQEYDAPPF